MKKVLTTILTALIFLNIPFVAFADEIDFDIWTESITQESISTSGEINKEPIINSRVAAVFDRDTKTILFSKDADIKVPMASTTKIMTMIVAIENGNLNDVVTVSKKAASIGGSRVGLKTGDKVKLGDLLYGLMLPSGNDAAIAVAEHIGGDTKTFCKMMTDKAKEIGANNTSFTSPHGLDDDEHYTTASDLCKITDYALNLKIFCNVVSQKYYTISINGNPKQLHNTNELLGVLEGVNGVKTGFTNKAGRCLVTSCYRDNLKLISVVLGADTRLQRAKDSTAILQYCFKNYELVNLSELALKNYQNNNIRVIKGKEEEITTELNRDQHIVALKKDDISRLHFIYETVTSIETPVQKGQKVGEFKIILNDKTLCTIDILCSKTVEKKNEKDYIMEIILNMTQYLQIRL